MHISKMVPLFTFLVIACGSQTSSPEIKSPVKVEIDGFSPLSEKQKAYYANAIEALYHSGLGRGNFSGGILLAKNGEIVFEDYRGFYNKQAGKLIDSTSPLHVASISKTFTSAAILKLMEEGKLALDDNVQKYLPTFPYSNITIKNLLSHRSGLQKYESFMQGTRTESYKAKNKKGRTITRFRTIKMPLTFTGLATNKDVLNYLATRRPALIGTPNRFYNYCNTNFAMLALVVEEVSGMDFPTYMTTYIFQPLGMKHSYIFSLKDTNNYVPSYNYRYSPFRLEKLDCIYGDKNVYTTVRDLLLWDRALYLGKFISAGSQALAYTPYSFEKRGEKNYGLGWHLLVHPPDPTIVYHNGWWHGNTASFKRLVADTATVIIIGNNFNRAIWSAGKMSSVFTGRVDTTSLDLLDQ
jgi:CubicO group peptidase (beta-lactamase class C family)